MATNPAGMSAFRDPSSTSRPWMRSMSRTLAVLALACAVTLPSGDAFARVRHSFSGSHSGSGSYGFGAPSRTPDIMAPPAASGSGKYGFGATAPSPAPAPGAASSSSGSARYGYGGAAPGQAAGSLGAPMSRSDAGLSRQASSAAAQRYRGEEAARFARPASSSGYEAPVRPARFYSDYGSYARSRDGFYGGWSRPPYLYQSRPSFGVWDALFMWWMLDSLTSHSHDRWFYDHQDDPGVGEWRTEANRLAADNADLRQKLADLDARTAGMAGPRDAASMPDDVKPEIALTADQVVREPQSSGVGPAGWAIGLAALGGLFFLAYRFYNRHSLGFAR
jgi:hypothetical protein